MVKRKRGHLCSGRQRKYPKSDAPGVELHLYVAPFPSPSNRLFDHPTNKQMAELIACAYPLDDKLTIVNSVSEKHSMVMKKLIQHTSRNLTISSWGRRRSAGLRTQFGGLGGRHLSIVWTALYLCLGHPEPTLFMVSFPPTPPRVVDGLLLNTLDVSLLLGVRIAIIQSTDRSGGRLFFLMLVFFTYVTIRATANR